MEDQDQAGPAEAAAAMLRDLTEAVTEVARRMFDLPTGNTRRN